MKILVLLSRIPYPLEKGDKLRGYYQVKELSKNHEVCLCCLSDILPHPEARKKLEEIASEVYFFPLSRIGIYLRMFLAMFGQQPFQVAYFYQRNVHKAIKKRIEAFKPDHIYCQLVRTTEYAKNEHSISKTLDYQDAFSKGMSRRAQREKNPLKKRFFRAEARRLLHYEHLIFEYFEHKCIISAQDKLLIYHENQSDIEVIPNGVDTDFFKPMVAEKEFDLCFVGNMSYAPNIDSAHFLVNQIMPLVWKQMPEAKVLISGATPSESVQKLENPRVKIAGWVDDIRTSYASSRLFVAPMQIGTGLQNKLLEAMAMKIPCITSALANNALGAAPGKHLLIGNDPMQYAEHIVNLLNHKQEAEQMAGNAQQFVAEKYTWAGSTARLEALMGRKL
jgi:sugar transferase (PEP-CTERM/EpsH1 system associated)